MGKVTRWFRSLLTSKRSPGKDQKSNTKWGFSDSSGTSIKFHTSVEDPLSSPYADGLDANKHAIAVAAATAAVAEAALAAAQAAAEVVRLTSSGGSTRTCIDRRLVLAAIRIQSAFRAYLARRALRALKGLVKLQALIRGRIVRKQSTDMLRRMQAMARIQARASAHRCYTSEYSTAQTRFSISHHFGNSNLRKHEVEHGRPHLKQSNLGSPITNGVGKESSQLAPRWLNHWMEHCTQNALVDDGRSDKILEIDTWKPRQNPNKASPASHYISAWNSQGEEHPRLSPSSRLSSKPNPSISSEEVASVLSSKLPLEDPVTVWTADNSPRVHSASSRPTSHRPFSPARSECSKSLFADYLGHPNYMANTESSQAKARSHSAPKQRIPIEELGWGAKFGRSHWESDAVFEKGSTLPAKQRTNTHIYTGQVKRQGASTRDVAATYSSLYGIRQ